LLGALSPPEVLFGPDSDDPESALVFESSLALERSLVCSMVEGVPSGEKRTSVLRSGRVLRRDVALGSTGDQMCKEARQEIE